MLPLFDLMMKAQNGNAVEAMSRQFGLAQEQMTQAMAALMPAFSTGLKRTATNPYDFSRLLAAASTGNYAQYFEDMSKAFSPQGIADGNTILGQIFGSKEVSRAVAAQAAQMSGIGQDIYKQMMPVMANAIMGGFLKQMAAQFQAAGEAIAAGNPQGVFDQWMKAAGLAETPKPGGQSLFDNPFTQSLQAMFGAGQTDRRTDGANLFANNPFLQGWEAMLKAAAPKETPPEPAAPEQQPQANPLADMVNQMFDSGIEVQKSYQKSMDAIFDSYMSSFKTPEGRKPE